MKYSEFKKLMNNKGFEVDVSKIRTIVYNREGDICGWVSNKEPEALDMTWAFYHDLPKKLRRFVGQKCFELAFTELKNREEEEEKFKLKQKGVSGKYLIWIPEIDRYTTGSSPFPNVEGVFTQSEIERMPECYTHPAVWEKIKVECEDEC